MKSEPSTHHFITQNIVRLLLFCQQLLPDHEHFLTSCTSRPTFTVMSERASAIDGHHPHSEFACSSVPQRVCCYRHRLPDRGCILRARDAVPDADDLFPCHRDGKERLQKLWLTGENCRKCMRFVVITAVILPVDTHHLCSGWY